MTKRARYTPEQYDERRGEARPLAKLTAADVLAIRKAREPFSRYVNASDKKRSLAYLARKYGVSPTVISHVANRRSWRHIP